MAFVASVNGNVGPAAEARVSVLDTGFTFGDGVYETLRTYGRRPFAFGRHLARLRASAARLGIDIPLPDEELRARLDALLAQTDHGESFVRLIVTRGVGDCSYKWERVEGPTVVMFARPHEAPPESAYTEGVDVVVVSVRRNHPQALDPAIKSINLLNNVLAVREAQARGAVEAVMLNQDGRVAEGSSSNFFFVHGSRLLTPPLDAGILAGITRDVVLELCREIGQPVFEEPVSVEQMFAADEAFLTSSLKEVTPVRAVDGRPVGSGRPGPVTLRLLQAYRESAPRHST